MTFSSLRMFSVCMGLVCLLFACTTAPKTQPPIALSWNDLADVTYEERFSDSLQQFLYWPNFGTSVKELEGRRVRISGYFFPMDSSYNVLSAKPFASCFFCGQAGPETVLEVAAEDAVKGEKMDAFLTLEGNFRLNADDENHLMYLLDSVKVVKDVKE